MRVFFLVLVSAAAIPLPMQEPAVSDAPAQAIVAPLTVVESVGAPAILGNQPEVQKPSLSNVGNYSGFDRFQPTAIEAATLRSNPPQSGASTQSQGVPASEPLRIGEAVGLQTATLNDLEAPQTNRGSVSTAPLGNTSNGLPVNPR